MMYSACVVIKLFVYQLFHVEKGISGDIKETCLDNKMPWIEKQSHIQISVNSQSRASVSS